MARDYRINGECLVLVKFGAHLPAGQYGLGSSGSATNLSELGLASEGIRIVPQFNHSDMRADDFGGKTPADVLWMMGEVAVRMTLVHYDLNVLDVCLAESMGGIGPNSVGLPGGFPAAGTMAPAGTPMGAGIPLLSSGNHYMSLNLTSPVLAFPWRFPACYLTGPPVEMPIGVDRTLAILNWRSIPYVSPRTITTGASGSTTTLGEIVSSGAILFDHLLDT